MKVKTIIVSDNIGIKINISIVTVTGTDFFGKLCFLYIVL